MRVVTGLDLETSGLLEPEHRIIEVALIMYDLDTEKKLGGFVRRFSPGRSIDAKAQAVHGISFEDVCNLPKLEDDQEAIGLIQRILSQSTLVVAHNGIEFDLPFLQMEFNRMGKQLPHCPVVDTMKQGRWATPLGKSPTLAELSLACGVDYDPEKAHAAEYDVDVMMKCFFHALPIGFYSLPSAVKEAIPA